MICFLKVCDIYLAYIYEKKDKNVTACSAWDDKQTWLKYIFIHINDIKLCAQGLFNKSEKYLYTVYVIFGSPDLSYLNNLSGNIKFHMHCVYRTHIKNYENKKKRWTNKAEI